MEPNNPSPQPIEQPHVNSYNKAHLILMGLFILAVVACVSFALGMFTQRQSDTAVNPYLKAVATPVPTKIVATPTTDPTAGWKIYNAHGFSLKYPPSWTYKEDTTNPIYTFFYDPSTGSNTGNGGAVQYASSLNVARIPTSGQTVAQYIDSLQSQQSAAALAAVFQKKTITLNGKQTEVYYQGGEGTVGWYIPFANGTGFDIFGPLSTDPSTDSIELQIVKTFSLSQ